MIRTDKQTVVALARLMHESNMLRQLEIVLAGAGQYEALEYIYKEIAVPSGDMERLNCVDPYQAAALRGDVSMIRWLHQQGAKPALAVNNALPVKDGRPNYCESLHLILATMRDDACTRAMLESGFIDAKLPVATEAMIYGCKAGSERAYLLADSRNPQVDPKQWVMTISKPTALDFAMVNDLPQSVDYLMSLGRVPSARTFTAMLAANAQDRVVEFMEANPGYGDQLLMAALNRSDLQAMRLALQFGGDPNLVVSTKSGGVRVRMPVLMACRTVEQMRVLVEAGADPNAMDDRGMSPLVLMIKSPDKFSAQDVAELVDMGADLGQGYNGQSILQVAARREESFKRMLRSLKSGKQILQAFDEPVEQASRPSLLAGIL